MIISLIQIFNSRASVINLIQKQLQSCVPKKLLLEISQNSQESSCATVFQNF